MVINNLTAVIESSVIEQALIEVFFYMFYYNFHGWCEGGVRQQRNDGGGCATMLERPESVASPGTYVTK